VIDGARHVGEQVRVAVADTGDGQTDFGSRDASTTWPPSGVEGEFVAGGNGSGSVVERL
jgi:hypothetical protein